MNNYFNMWNQCHPSKEFIATLLILLHLVCHISNVAGTESWKKNIVYCRETRHYDVLITFFTSWPLRRHQERPFVYENVLKNWKSLGTRVQIAVFTNDTEIKAFCLERNVDVLPLISASPGGKPLVRPMYLQVIEKYKSVFYSFVNSDLLLSPTITDILDLIVHSNICDRNPIFIMGARTNIMVMNETLPGLSSNWKGIEEITKKEGVTFPETWSLDYYMTSLHYPWNEVPDVVHGSVKLDNYMIWNALRHNHTTIDITNAFLAIHQSYRILTDSLNGPEKEYNVDLLKKVEKSFQVNKIASSGRTNCAEFVVGYDYFTTNLRIMKNRVRKPNCFNL